MKAPQRIAESALRKHGLRYVAPDELVITRRRAGRGFAFYTADEQRVSDAKMVRRLKSLAVPPAYADVHYAADPSAHIQAIGRDAAGRLQYRYHPEWEKLREARKARRLARLMAALPRIRRGVKRDLSLNQPVRELALAAIVDLVARTAIRAGSEEYLRSNRTRGAATLLKSDLTLEGPRITLKFRGKGAREVGKSVSAPRLAHAVRLLMPLKGRRLFQYREGAEVRAVTARDVNAYLRSLAGVTISLKDFRTLTASTAALSILVRMTPEKSARLRRKQVREVMGAVADELANTPAIARRSYVHDAIVEAFESGRLRRLGRKRVGAGSTPLLAKVIEDARAAPVSVKTALRRSVQRVKARPAGQRAPKKPRTNGFAET